jgi:F-type H+-transporting ATPase subunit delta
MNTEVAKKYVKALMKSVDDNEFKEAFSSLKRVADAFASEKFVNIIFSPDISKEAKEKLIQEIADAKNEKLVNFIKILSSNDRIGEIPSIVKEIKYQIAQKDNEFIGTLISNFEIDESKKKMLEENLSSKFNAKIKLENVVSEYPGIKIELDDLGVEVSFSIERLKTQMIEHILKAI